MNNQTIRNHRTGKPAVRRLTSCTTARSVLGALFMPGGPLQQRKPQLGPRHEARHLQNPQPARVHSPLFLFDPRNTKRGAPISDPPFYTYGTLSGRFDDVSVLFLGEVWSRVAEETLLAGEVAL